MTAFHLEVASDGLATLTFDAPDRKLNVFDRAALEELDALTVDLAQKGGEISVLVLVSGKRQRGFIAGADVDLIAAVSDAAEAAEGSRDGQRIFAAWERLPFPTVAAIEGICVGGGTEIALASTYRVVSDADAVKVGLPEVKLGILPGWGGCTRLPRLLSLPDALDLILTGRNLRPKQLLRKGFADAMLPASGFLGHLRDFARAHAGKKRSLWERHGGFNVKELLMERNPLGRKLVFDQARKTVMDQTGGNYPAPLAALDVVRTGLEDGPAAGFAAESRAIGDLAVSGVCKNLIHVFQLSEGAKKLPGLPGGEARPVRSAAVLGAGAMGGGIAQLLAHKADLPVVMKDIRSEGLADGMKHVGALFRKLVDKRRLSEPEAERQLQLVHPTLRYDAFHRVDLVIEAVVEKLPVKQAVFEEVATQVPPGTVLATNTSSLPIDQIGTRTPEPEKVVGMHFFNPVHMMPLVEVVLGERTGAEAANTIYELSRRLGKTPVFVKDSPGFLVNRLLTFYSVEAQWLLAEGYRIQDVDRAMKGWGMPMGPLALGDEVGLDVAVEVAKVLSAAYPDRLPLPEGLDKLIERGLLGKKSGRGLYEWEARKRQGPNKEVYALVGVQPSVEEPDPRYLQERMVLPMIDEAARCLEEEIVASAGELDLAMIFGTGFPPFRGGPCRWADRQGLGWAIETLGRLAKAVGERYAPSDALKRTAEAGGFYARFGDLGDGTPLGVKKQKKKPAKGKTKKKEPAPA